jgi:ABC-2 type transport system ATP-binding protein
MEVIKTTNLTKKFDRIVAVKNLNLSIDSGIFYCLLGPNGSGKTTAVRMLTGQIKPTSGKASVLGIDIKNYIEVRKNLGIVPEEEYPPSFLTPLEYLKFVCKIRKIGVGDADEKIEQWLNMLDFKQYQNILVKDLSRGTKQKLMLAQAFIHEPKIVFLDEPFINIDPIIQKNFKKFLRSYVKAGNTIFFCTHIMPLVKELCDKVGILKEGMLVKEAKSASAEREFFRLFEK